jgi:hypothetical protein
MSSKKIYMTIGMAAEMMEAIKKEAEVEQRSVSSMVSWIIKNHFTGSGEQGDKQCPLKFQD